MYRFFYLSICRSFASGFSAHEVRSVTEEDVNFSRRRVLTSAHFVPPPDYPMGDADQSPYTGPHWAANLPDPRRYEIPPVDYVPITPAFATTGRGRPRQRIPDHSSSVFGGRRLVDPYRPSYTAASPSMRRRFGAEGRSYSPDIDALSLEPSSGLRAATSYVQSSQSYTAAARGSTTSAQRHLYKEAAVEDREEIKSTTETDIYDWKRYS